MLLLLLSVLLLQCLHCLLVVEQVHPPQILLNLVELGGTHPPVVFNRLQLFVVLVLDGLDVKPVLVVDALEVSVVQLPNSLKGPLSLLVLLQLVNLKPIFLEVYK